MTARDLPALIEWTMEVACQWARSSWDSREERRLRGLLGRLVAECGQRLAGFQSRCETVVALVRTAPAPRRNAA